MLAADYPFLDVLWTMLIFFLWIIWFWILITVFIDLFRRKDTSGVSKVLWIIFVILVVVVASFHFSYCWSRPLSAFPNIRGITMPPSSSFTHSPAIATRTEAMSQPIRKVSFATLTYDSFAARGTTGTALQG